MIAGDSKPKLLILEAPDGTALSFADKTAFQAAGWDLTWRDVDGAALSSQPTWTIATEGSGRHLVKYSVPTGYYWVEPTIPVDGSGVAYVIAPETWANEGQVYDDDAIAGLLLTAQGVPAIISADDGTLGDVVHGDSWTSATQQIPLGKISRFGYAFADLASGWTISAGFKSQPSDTMVNSGVTAAFVSATSGTYNVSWNTFPTGMNLSSTEESKQWFMDVQLKRTTSTTIITVARWSVNVVWQRDTTP